MKKIIILAVVLIFALSSCDTEPADISETPKTTNTNEIQETIVPINTEPITLILINSILNTNDEKMGDYASSLLASKGNNVDIKFYNINYQTYEYSVEQYKNFIREEIGKGKNLIFETGIDISDLVSEGLIYDARSNTDSPEISVGMRQRLSYTGVFIDSQIEKEYGKEINNTDDYDLFLQWASKNATNKIPGCIILNGGIGESFSPIALFAQENGYARVDKSIGSIGEGLVTNYIYIDDIKNVKKKSPTVYQAVELPCFDDMDQKLNRWKENEYVEFKGISENINTAEYSSIVMNTYNTNEYYSIDYRNPDFQLMDVSDFNLHIFTEDGIFNDSPLISNVDYSSKFAISSNSPSPKDITGFIDWIYSSLDNYMLFMCGVEGLDYEIVDGQILFKSNHLLITYGQWYKHISFVDPEMGLLMPHFPANWEEINSKLSDINGENIVKLVGNENLPADLWKFLHETAFESTLQKSYAEEVVSMYTKYFNDLKKNDSKYTSSDLVNDVRNSAVALEKKKAYEEFIDYIIGN